MNGPRDVLLAAGRRSPGTDTRRGTGRRWERWTSAVLLDGRDAGLSARQARWVFWSPLVGGLLVAAMIVHKPFFVWLLTEDHPVEWLQFTALMFTSLTAVVGAVRMARRGQWAAAGLYVLLALGTAVLGGEEISWGQRAFALTPPAELASVNDQRELNLHNVVLSGLNLDALSDYVSSALSAVLVGLSLMTRPFEAEGHGRPRWDAPALRVITPALVLVPALALSAVVPFGQLVPRVAHTLSFWKFEEWSELCRYLALAALATEWARRYRGGRRVDAPARTSGVDPLVVGSAVVAAVVTVVLAVLSQRHGIQIVHVQH